MEDSYQQSGLQGFLYDADADLFWRRSFELKRWTSKGRSFTRKKSGIIENEICSNIFHSGD